MTISNLDVIRTGDERYFMIQLAIKMDLERPLTLHTGPCHEDYTDSWITT